jgi:hypothetical protein
MLEQTIYHKVLRVGAAVLALVLVFESGLVSESTQSLSIDTHQFVANVIGVGASVRPTELNSLTAEITEQRMLLDQREAAIRDREIEIGLAEGESNETATYLIAALLFILLVLIVTNYILDYLRAQKPVVSREQIPVQ